MAVDIPFRREIAFEYGRLEPVAPGVRAIVANTPAPRDHSPAANALKAATGAPPYGFGPHAGGKRGEAGVEEGGDWDFMPDIVTTDGEESAGGKWRFEAVQPPGHNSNHLCFAQIGR